MKLLIADDHALFRQGLSMMMTTIFQNCYIYQANNWEKVHQSLNSHHFDLVLLDIFMPREQTWEEELIQVITQYPEMAICVISASSEVEHLQTVFHIGVKGFICKTASTTEITDALLQIKQGNTYFPAPLLQKMGQIDNEGSISLTLRQREIVKLMKEGKNNKIIARELNLTENTVKRHIYNICQTLHVNNRMEAIALIHKRDLLNSY